MKNFFNKNANNIAGYLWIVNALIQHALRNNPASIFCCALAVLYFGISMNEKNKEKSNESK